MGAVSPKQSKEQEAFEKLRSILLDDDREKIKALNEELLEQQKFSSKVNPLIDEKIVELRQKFPEYFGDTITATIKTQIKDSQDEVVEALYPIIGKLIKKFIRSEISRLSEKINSSIKSTFSFKGQVRRVKNKISGVSDGDAILADAIPPKIEGVFVIEKNSGLLKANYSSDAIVDEDILAGMLTAIKAFAEDAFKKEGESLESIDYETFELFIQNFKSIYVVCVVSGAITSDFKDVLNDKINDFGSEVFSNRSLLDDENQLKELIEKKIVSL